MPCKSINMPKLTSRPRWLKRLSVVRECIDVLLDDRKERPGVVFADMELIGVPHTIVIGDRNLDNGKIEYKYRRDGEKKMIKVGEIVNFLLKNIVHSRALSNA